MESELDIQTIKEYLPHRYPFLMVDRVIECNPKERLVAIKNVTNNEPYFIGHFPAQPIMPGVLIMEALAQATGLLAAKSAPEELGKGMTYYLVGLDKARFRRPVVPGDQLVLEVKYLRDKRNIWVFSCCAMVDGEIAASAEIMCAAAVDES